jgi:hypothetical protein
VQGSAATPPRAGSLDVYNWGPIPVPLARQEPRLACWDEASACVPASQTGPGPTRASAEVWVALAAPPQVLPCSLLKTAGRRLPFPVQHLRWVASLSKPERTHCCRTACAGAAVQDWGAPGLISAEGVQIWARVLGPAAMGARFGEKTPHACAEGGQGHAAVPWPQLGARSVLPSGAGMVSPPAGD